MQASSLWLGTAVLAAALWKPTPAMVFRVAKADFHLLAMEVQCRPGCEYPDDVTGSVLDMGFAGEGRYADPNRISQSPDSGGSRVVVGFPEERFDWARFTQNLPGTPYKLAVLNELTSSGKNFAFLTVWKPVRDSFDFVRLLPGHFSVALGEISFQGAPRAEGSGVVVLLKGIGSDAGINLQAFFAVRLRGIERLEKAREITNRSEIPVADILARLNEGKPVEEVLDSSLQCDLGKGARAALRCTKSRSRILYTQAGPQETPLGKETFTLELAPSRGRR